MSITVELHGLEVFGYHGVEEYERRDGQPFVFDIWFEVSDAALSDGIRDTVDYRQVAESIKEISDTRRFSLIEALAAAVADELVSRFPVRSVTVRVRKPKAHLAGLPIDFAAASVTRP